MPIISKIFGDRGSVTTEHL